MNLWITLNNLIINFHLSSFIFLDEGLDFFKNVQCLAYFCLGLFHFERYTVIIESCLEFWLCVSNRIKQYNAISEESMSFSETETLFIGKVDGFIENVLNEFVDSRFLFSEYISHSLDNIDEDPLLVSFEEFEVLDSSAFAFCVRNHQIQLVALLLNRLSEICSHWLSLHKRLSPQQDFLDEYKLVESKFSWGIHIFCNLLNIHRGIEMDFNKIDSMLKTPGFFDIMSIILRATSALDQYRELSARSSSFDLLLLERKFAINIRFELSIIRFLHTFFSLLSSYKGDDTHNSLSPTIKKITELFCSQGNEINSWIAVKSIHNFTFLSQSELIIDGTLRLFRSIALDMRLQIHSTCSDAIPLLNGNTNVFTSSKFIQENIFSKNLDNFEFLNRIEYSSSRSIYHETMTAVFFLSEEDIIERDWNMYMLRMDHQFTSLFRLSVDFTNSRQIYVNHVSNLLRDLTAISKACNTPFTFSLLYDWLFENRLESLIQMVFPEDCTLYSLDLCIRLLQLAAELTDNFYKRFGSNCDNPRPLVIFRTVCRIVHSFLRVTPLNFQSNSGEELNVEKGISLCLLSLSRGLKSGFINLGIMRYFNDENAEVIESAIRSLEQFPLALVHQYTKIGHSVMSFVEAICLHDSFTILNFSSLDSVRKILFMLRDCLAKYVTESSSHMFRCSLAGTGHLLGTLLDCLLKNKEVTLQMNCQRHLESFMDIYIDFMEYLLNYALNCPYFEKWTVGQHIFSLFVLFPFDICHLKLHIIELFCYRHMIISSSESPNPKLEQFSHSLDEWLNSTQDIGKVKEMSVKISESVSYEDRISYIRHFTSLNISVKDLNSFRQSFLNLFSRVHSLF